MKTAGMFWNFYDDFGMCVCSVAFSKGDTHQNMADWWFDLIEDEEYNPGASSLVLEAFNGEDNQ